MVRGTFLTPQWSWCNRDMYAFNDYLIELGGKKMNDLIEIVEDLESIQVFGAETTAFEEIVQKWAIRKEDAELEMEKQMELDLHV